MLNSTVQFFDLTNLPLLKDIELLKYITSIFSGKNQAEKTG